MPPAPPPAGLLWSAVLAGGCSLGLALLLARELAKCRTELAKLSQSRVKQQVRPKLRSPVTITPEDRVAPAKPETLALRPDADPRVDPAVLICCGTQVDASRRSGAAVLIVPGGNYESCSLRLPLQVATWLTELGLVAFVLRYRLRSEGHYWPAQAEDCKDALELIRRQGPRFGVDPGSVGVLGFSAGGHLASLAATAFEEGARPNFHILVYPTTNVETPIWDPWKARHGFPGPELNTFTLVSRATPPLFAAVSKDDEVTSYQENTLPYVQACKRAGVEAELVLASMGPHGHPMVDTWTKPCEQWLRKHGWVLG